LSWTTTRNSNFPGGTETDEEAIVRIVVKRGAILVLVSEKAIRDDISRSEAVVYLCSQPKDEVIR
jgi:hypothetical protein